MSIFKQDCPECAAPNPMDAIVCGCGYCFDPDALAEADPEAYARQQDRLYLEYLAARAVRAEADAASARAVARADPENRQKAAATRNADAALVRLRIERDEWSRRVRAAPRPASPALKRPSPPLPPGGQRPAHAPPAPRTVSTPGPRVTAEPDANFRRRQAARADVVVPSRRTPAAGVPSVAPGSASPLRRRAATSAQAPTGATQECPNCTATVPAGATRCRCGYALARPGEEVPALALDAAALAILAEGITFTGPTRRR